MKALIDTSAITAHLFAKDSHHAAAVQALSESRAQLIVAAPVLVELSWVLVQRIGYQNMIRGIQAVRENFEVEALVESDFIRMEAIMRQYASAELDYVDTAIMALSERLRITQVYTFDRRDFGIFRPIHCPALELLP